MFAEVLVTYKHFKAPEHIFNFIFSQMIFVSFCIEDTSTTASPRSIQDWILFFKNKNEKQTATLENSAFRIAQLNEEIGYFLFTIDHLQRRKKEQ